MYQEYNIKKIHIVSYNYEPDSNQISKARKRFKLKFSNSIR